MEANGLVFKIDEDYKYGFIKVKNMEDVFFTEKTEFKGISFEQLKPNDSVRVSIIKTDRGLFAQTLCFSPSEVNKPVLQKGKIKA